MKRFFLGILFCCILSGLTATNIKRIAGSPFPFSTAPDRLYLTSENYTYSQKITLQSLQGILAKTKPEILRDVHGHKAVVAKEGITFDQTYYTNFSGLLTHFADRLDGYILCTANESSVNVAMSLAGPLNAVAVPADIEATAKAAGLTMILDVRGMEESDILDNPLYESKFSKNIASYQNCTDDRALFLGDFSVFTNAFQFWDSDANGALSTAAFARMNEGGAIFGYVPSEYNTVDQLSKKSLVLHPSDFSPNFSTLCNIPTLLPKQKDPIKRFEVVPNVHTVCFVMSDGDNMQWLSGASDDANTWADLDRARLNLGWTISPAFAEIAPIMYKKYLQNALTTKDGRNVLVAGPSGRGYFFPSDFPTLANECKLLNMYMKKADLGIVNILDVDVAAHNPTEYLKQSNIDALFYYTYGSNYRGMNGAISWYKDKPSIGGRYTLWETLSTPEYLAGLLNNSSTNVNLPDGYSLVPVHVWSRKVDDVLDCIKRLGPNVRVVAPDEFVWLIRKNIKKVPLGNGLGLKGEYFSGSNFDVLKYSETNSKINFDWETESPNKTLLGTDQFSVRWSGQIQPVYTNTYNFYVTADDGVKLTINGTVLIDALTNTGDTITRSGTIALISGQKYDIQLEYAEKTGESSCCLEWESPSQLRQPVPMTQLYSRSIPSTGLVTAYSDADFGGFSSELLVGEYTLSDLNNLGIYDKDIASLKVTNGFKVILYEEDNFGGQSMELTSDNTNLADWADKASSLKVKTNGDPNLEGIYFLQNRSSSFNMDVPGGVTGVAEGLIIQQWTVTTNLNQQFKLTHLGDGCYSIQPMHSLKSLDITGFSKLNGASVQQWTYYGSSNQRFILIPTGDGYYKIMSENSGKIIEVISNSLESKTRQLTDANQTRGQWKLNAVPKLENGTGNGLDASYYNGMDFTTLRHAQIDTTINFNWGTAAPNAYVGADNFSVKWTGRIQPRTTGTYTFYINSDNGRRLYINNQLIIDKWISDYDIEYSGTINLVKGQYYDIELDYFEDAGGASCIFEWFSSSQPREVVPKSQLYSKTNGVDKNNYSQADVKIYPIPVTNKTMNVVLTGLNEYEKTTLTIFDLVGKPLIHQQLTDAGIVDLKSIPAGAYIVNVSSKNMNINNRIVVE